MSLPRFAGPGVPLARVTTAALLAMVALSLSGCNLFKSQPTTLPLPMDQYLPDQWRLLPDSKSNLNELQEINIDNDAESEWLLFYFFDNIPNGANGPIGGLIYDGQQNTEIYNPDVVIPFPFQPAAFLVPYRLLPNWTPGTGQGYLGDVTVSYEQTTINTGRTWPDELVVFGYGPGNVVTRLSVFWWQGITTGYGVAHFVGSQGVFTPGRQENQPVRQVITLNRFNDRSNLCKQNVFNRQGNSPAWDESPSSIVFCQSTPPDGPPPQLPTYPEATALAYMLSGEKSLIVDGQNFQVEQTFDRRRFKQVTSLTYTGVAPTVGTGTDAVTTEEVKAVVDMDTGQETYTWQMLLIKPKMPNETAVWKILGVQLAP